MLVTFLSIFESDTTMTFGYNIRSTLIKLLGCGKNTHCFFRLPQGIYTQNYKIKLIDFLNRTLESQMRTGRKNCDTYISNVDI